jgi:hypothetical protein
MMRVCWVDDFDGLAHVQHKHITAEMHGYRVKPGLTPKALSPQVI